MLASVAAATLFGNIIGVQIERRRVRRTMARLGYRETQIWTVTRDFT